MTTEETFDKPEIPVEQLLDEETLREQAALIESASLEALFEDLDNIETELTDIEPDYALLNTNSTLESLMDIVGNLQEAEAISRMDAMTIRQMTSSLEGFGDIYPESLPMNSFTELPSRVNYDAAMESIISSAARFVIETIKKIIIAIRDAVKKTIAFFRRNSVTAKKAETVARRVSTTYKQDIVAAKLKNATVDGGRIALPEGKHISVDALMVRIAEDDFINRIVGAFDEVIEGIRPDTLLITEHSSLKAIDKVVMEITAVPMTVRNTTDALQGLSKVRATIVTLNTQNADIDVVELPNVINGLARNINIKSGNLISARMEQLTRLSNDLQKDVADIEKQIRDLRTTPQNEENIKRLEGRSKSLWGISLIISAINEILGYLSGKLARVAKMVHELQTT